jgi:hypothetical protein
MSHFSVLVVGENPEEQLAPFQENNMGNHPCCFLEFEDCTEDYRRDAEEIEEDPEANGKTRLEYYGQGDFDKFCKEWDGCGRDPITGKYGRWENPNAKWDWYKLAGRFSGKLIRRNGTKADDALLTNGSDLSVDWDAMKSTEMQYALKEWERFQKLLKTDASPRDFYFEFGLGIGADREKIPTEELFIKQFSSIATFAVVIDKTWHQKAGMGWFGSLSNEKSIDDWNSEFLAIVDNLDTEKNRMVSVYDCHI